MFPLLHKITNFNILIISVLIIVVLISAYMMSRTIEGFSFTSKKTERTAAYNINMDALEATYDDNMMKKKKDDPNEHTAEMLDNQLRERKLLKAAVVQRERDLADKLDIVTKDLANSKKNVIFGTKVVTSNVDSLADAAGDFQVDASNKLDQYQKEFDNVTAAHRSSKQTLNDVTNLFELAAEHELAQKVFNPYGDPKNAAAIEECNKLGPSPGQ